MYSNAANGVSGDGTTAVGSVYNYSAENNGGIVEAFRWNQADGMVSIDFILTNGSSALGVSADGTVIVGLSVSLGSAFRWTQATGMVALGGGAGEAFDASADGSVVVGYGNSANGIEAFRWTQAEGVAFLGDLPGGNFQSVANGVSADGSVVVGGSVYASSPSLGEAFRWTQATGMVGLGFIPDHLLATPQSDAGDISADGSTIVGYGTTAGGGRAFRWTQATGMVDLGLFPGAGEASASGVSGDGSVIVGSAFTVLGLEAIIWDAANGMRNLKDVLINDYGLGASLAGWHLQDATDISDGDHTNGLAIVGFGIAPHGLPEAFIAVIPLIGGGVVPEPSTIALAAMELFGFIAARRRTT